MFIYMEQPQKVTIIVTYSQDKELTIELTKNGEKFSVTKDNSTVLGENLSDTQATELILETILAQEGAQEGTLAMKFTIAPGTVPAWVANNIPTPMTITIEVEAAKFVAYTRQFLDTHRKVQVETK